MPSDDDRRLRVAFCDDAVGFPLLLTKWFEDMDDVELVATAEHIDELIAQLGRIRPDVVLVDYMLRDGRTSRAVLDRVRCEAPGALVVLMSSLPASVLEVNGRTVGADAVWPKSSGAEALRATLTEARSARPDRAQAHNE